MKKALFFLFLALMLSVAAVAVAFECFPGSSATRFIDPWCRTYYMTAREKVLGAVAFVRAKTCSSGECCTSKDESPAEKKRKSSVRKSDPVCCGVDNAKAPPARSKRALEKSLTDESPVKELDKPTLKEARWYSGRRLGVSDFRGKIVIGCVWNVKDAASFELLRNAQRISDGFRGKPLVVFASHRGGETPDVRRILEKEDIVIPCCEGAGHPDEPKSVSKGPVFYMLDKAGKLRYYGRNDKAMIVRLVDLLSS